MAMAMRAERRPGVGPEAAGFSLIEVMVAGLILLVIALGLVPIYTRSIRSNIEGFDYTRVSNAARSKAEELLQLPFNSPELTVPGGETELEAEDFFSQQEHEWFDEDEWSGRSGDVALFTRTATVRQFGIADLTTPLDGDAPPDAVHLKEITVTVEGTRAGALGGGKDIAVRVLKSQ
ncbi:MAG: hypothetical protein ACLF0P_01340 [Thermoanaerobaculia bacterium]